MYYWQVLTTGVEAKVNIMKRPVNTEIYVFYILSCAILCSVFFACDRGRGTIELDIRCLDENGDAVERAEITVNGEQMGHTKGSGVFSIQLPKGTKDVTIIARKGGIQSEFEYFDAERTIADPSPKEEIKMVMWRKLSVSVEWEQIIKPGEPRIPVADGVITVTGIIGSEDEETNTITGMTDAKGKVTLRYFKAKAGDSLNVSGTRDGVPSESRIVDIKSYKTYFQTSLVSVKRVPIEVEVTVTGFSDLSYLSDIELKVEGNKVEPEQELNLLKYEGYVVEDEIEIRVRYSRNEDYVLIPDAWSIDLKSGQEGPYTITTSAKYQPIRTFVINCEDESGNSFSGAAVYMNEISAREATDSSGTATVAKRFRDDAGVEITLRRTGFSFEFIPPNSNKITIGNNRSEYRLRVRAVPPPVVVTISSLNQEGDALPGVSVTSDNRSISGTTDNNGVLRKEVRASQVGLGRTVHLTFSKDEYFIDMEIPMEIPRTGNASLKRYLLKMSSPKHKIGVGPFEFRSPESSKDGTDDIGLFRQYAGEILEGEYKFFSVSKEFQDVPVKDLYDGWDSSRIPVDFMLIGEIVVQDQALTDASIVLLDKENKIIISEGSKYKQISEIATVTRRMIRELMKKFPFYGQVLSVSSNSISVNLGTQHRMQVGNSLDIYHSERDEEGRLSGEPRAIGTAKVTEVKLNESTAQSIELDSGERVSAGDLVKRDIEAGEKGLLTVEVTHHETGRPVEGMNLYFGADQRYGGRTDATGKASFGIPRTTDITILGMMSRLEIKPKQIRIIRSKETKQLRAEPFVYYLTISSDSPGCDVYIDNKIIGGAPVNRYPIEAGVSYALKLIDESSGRERELTVIFPDDRSDEILRDLGIRHKVSKKDVELYVQLGIPLDDGRRAKVESLEQSKKYKEAIELLKAVSKRDHYIESRQWAGSIYANKVQDYDKAIEMFKQAVAHDERAAAAYYNLGWSYYKKRNYSEAIEYLNKVYQYKSFLVKEDSVKIRHDARYYNVLAKDAEVEEAEEAGRSGDVTNLVTYCNNYIDFYENTLKGSPEYKDKSEYYDGCYTEIMDIATGR